MADPVSVQEGRDIILRGSFNPLIFQPAWFAQQSLMPQPETESVENLLVTSDLTTFTAGWLFLAVTRDRFLARTQDSARYEALRDLVVGTFQLLVHTPVVAMGLNIEAHYRLSLPVTPGQVLDRFLPAAVWASCLEDPAPSTLTVKGKRRDDYLGYVQVRLEPSVPFKDDGIYLAINDHIAFPAAAQTGAAAMLEALQRTWVPSKEMMARIVDQVVRT